MEVYNTDMQVKIWTSEVYLSLGDLHTTVMYNNDMSQSFIIMYNNDTQFYCVDMHT